MRSRQYLRKIIRSVCQRGAPAAKRAWTERNMIEDISAGLGLWEDFVLRRSNNGQLPRPQ
jgi:hypothetical protein